MPRYNEKHQLIAVCPSQGQRTDCWDDIIAHCENRNLKTWDHIRHRCSKLEIQINCWLKNSQTLEKMSDAVRSRPPLTKGHDEVRLESRGQDDRGQEGRGQGWSVLWVPVVFLLSTVCLYLLSLGITGLDTGKRFVLH